MYRNRPGPNVGGQVLTIFKLGGIYTPLSKNRIKKLARVEGPRRLFNRIIKFYSFLENLGHFHAQTKIL